MPKVKYANEKDLAIWELVERYLKKRGRNQIWLIKITGIPEQTYYKAKRNPEYLKVCQLRAILDTLRVPEDERRGII